LPTEPGGQPPSQPAAAAPAADAGDQAQPADAAAPTKLAPVENVPRQKLRPPELVAEALTAPREGALTGKPLRLVEALSHTPDRQQQLRITQAYWRLSAAQALYHWALDERGLLGRYTSSGAESPTIASARVAAEANVRDAQLAVGQAQQELADVIGTAGADNLPLAVDRPHVGSYNTLYEEIFGNRPAPPRIRLIHRMLPIRRQAIDAHGAAVVATLDALEATAEELRSGGQGLATLLGLFEQLSQQRRAFIDATREYNHEIAEYLFAVVRPGTSDQVLVSRLILSSGPSGGTTPAAPRQAVPPASQQPEQPTQPAAGASAAVGEPSASNYRPEDLGDLLDDGALYGGMAQLNAPARVQKLSELLHWDRQLPDELGRPTPLADCLRSVGSTDRPAVLKLYWQTRERAARYQVISDQLERLNALAAAAIALRNEPGMAEAGVRLQAARRAAQAAALEAQLALVESEFQLTQAAGRRLEEVWLLPTTPPQSGRYVVAANGGLQPAVRRLAQAVALRHEELELRTDAVIRCDQLRAESGSNARAASGGQAPAASAAGELSALDRVVWAVVRQAEETLVFLNSLTEYNLAIARYVLATTPPGTSNEDLVRRLVIARTARGES
jgi:hypothetical protein